MDMRSDALCTAAEIILELEKIGKQESAYQSVATVGVIQNYPNVLNVIPGCVEIGVDMRGIDQDSLNCMERNFKAAVRESCKKRGVEYVAEKINSIPPIRMSSEVETAWNRRQRSSGSRAGECRAVPAMIPCLLRISATPAWYSSRAAAEFPITHLSTQKFQVSVTGRG